jgi:8-oxo-dGTP pyrophosphatase MutT (NUDIX family)
MHYAAGVLPLTWADPYTPLFLVGRDIRDGTWSDFGGKCEKIDRDVAATASREFWEETCGVLMDLKTARTRLFPGNCIVIRGATQNRHPYWSFIIEVPFVSHARDAFAKQLAFLRHRNVHRAYVEKTDIMYVDLPTLLSDALPKRGVFSNTIMQHRDTLERIAAAGMMGFEGLCHESQFP